MLLCYIVMLVITFLKGSEHVNSLIGVEPYLSTSLNYPNLDVALLIGLSTLLIFRLEFL